MKRLITFDTVRDIGLALPGVEASTSYGTAALKVKGKLFASLKEDGESLDHYLNYPWVQALVTDRLRGLTPVMGRLKVPIIWFSEPGSTRTLPFR